MTGHRKLHADDHGNNLRLGQENQHLCVDHVKDLLQLAADAVVYDGTRPDAPCLPTGLIALNRRVVCRPDLIVRQGGSLSLFEFKAVADRRYLQLEEFPSDVAQIQCYTYLTGDHTPSHCYLLRYFVDPFEEGCCQLKKLTRELFLSGFRKLWKQYEEAIRVLENSHNIDPSRPELKDTFNAARPEEGGRKCSSCSYNYVCQIRGWKGRRLRRGKLSTDWH